MSLSGKTSQQLNDIVLAFDRLMFVADDYLSYEHDGDTWTEDARTMGEMEIDDMKSSGDFDKFKQLLASPGVQRIILSNQNKERSE